MYYNLIALIPARLNSKRIPMKNVRILSGHPLLAYAIQSAKDSELFDGIYVSSDSDKIGEIAIYYGAEFIKRPQEFAQDLSPDIDWIIHVFEYLKAICFNYAIIRPTNPFRTGGTIKKAFKEWDKKSLMKAVEPVKQHPAKMWRCVKWNTIKMSPYINNNYHLLPTQSFEQLYIQNASLEFRKPIGSYINNYQPFFTEGYEGFDINTVNDWILAEALIKKGWAKLPKIDKEPYDFSAV